MGYDFVARTINGFTLKSPLSRARTIKVKKSSYANFLNQPPSNSASSEKLYSGKSRRDHPAAILFDMDGLLIDSERMAQEATFVTARVIGHPISEAVALRMIGLGSDALGRMLIAEFGEQFPFDEYQRVWNEQYQARVNKGVPVKSGVVDALAAVRAAGLRSAVATSTSTHFARHKLEKAGLLVHFDVVVGRDAVVHGKPAPDLYLHAAGRLGFAAAHCWAFEDSLPGLTAAVASGARAHWVPDLAHIQEHELPSGVETIESLHTICEWLSIESKR